MFKIKHKLHIASGLPSTPHIKMPSAYLELDSRELVLNSIHSYEKSQRGQAGLTVFPAKQLLTDYF